MRGALFPLAVVFVFCTVSPAPAEEPHAPPVLTPALVRQLGSACPGAAPYADALARGSDEADAAAAAQLFENCAGDGRRQHAEARRFIASAAAGGAYLALGLLRHDPAMLRRSIDATDEMRRAVPVSDEQIRRWSTIPDAIDMEHHKLLIVTTCGIGDPSVAAAYINVAAHDGAAWITAARAPLTGCPALAANAYDPPDKAHPLTLPRGTDTKRPDPAIDRDVHVGH